MPLAEKLMAFERELWLGGADAYREHVDEHCLLAFVEMAGVVTRERVAASVEGDERWSDVRMERVGVLEPSRTIAFLTYEAHAVRGGGRAYAALVTSAYVKRRGGWKLAFHQQTPRSREPAG